MCHDPDIILKDSVVHDDICNMKKAMRTTSERAVWLFCICLVLLLMAMLFTQQSMVVIMDRM